MRILFLQKLHHPFLCPLKMGKLGNGLDGWEQNMSISAKGDSMTHPPLPFTRDYDYLDFKILGRTIGLGVIRSCTHSIWYMIRYVRTFNIYDAVSDVIYKGSLQIDSLEKFDLLSQLRGGLPIPNFDSIFPRVFLLQYGGGSQVPTNKITKNHIKNHQSPKKCDFSMKK